MKKSNPRGRPKRYDREKALDQITQVFWEHGFAATSLDMVSAATSMKRPSLYAAFGDKRAMFLTVQTRFAENLSSDLANILMRPHAPTDVLKDFFKHLIETYTSGPNAPYGCLVFSVGLVEAVTETEVGALIRQVNQSIENDLRSFLERAIKSGALPKAKDTDVLTSLLVALIHSIAVRARSGVKPSSLTDMAERAIHSLLI